MTRFFQNQRVGRKKARKHRRKGGAGASTRPVVELQDRAVVRPLVRLCQFSSSFQLAVIFGLKSTCYRQYETRLSTNSRKERYRNPSLSTSFLRISEKILIPLRNQPTRMVPRSPARDSLILYRLPAGAHVRVRRILQCSCRVKI